MAHRRHILSQLLASGLSLAAVGAARGQFERRDWMDPALNPSTVLKPTLQFGYTDSNDIAGIAFSPNGDRMYVSSSPEVVNFWAVLVYHWPEVGGGLAALVGLPSLLWAARALRRHQVHGRCYCPRCNYDLGDSRARESPGTPAAPGTPANTANLACSECGLDLRNRPPRAAQGPLRRARVPLILLVATAVPYAALWAGQTPRKGWVQNEFFWCWRAIEEQFKQIPGDPLLPFRGAAMRLDAVDCTSGEVLRTLALRPGPAVISPSISPDGQWLFFKGYGTVECIEASSGRVVGKLSRVPSLVSPGDRALVDFDVERRAAYFSRCQDNESQLCEWFPASGELRVVVSEPCAVPGESRQYAVIGAGTDRQVVSAPGMQEMETRRSHIRLFGLDGASVRRFDAPERALGYVAPTVSRVGKLYWPKFLGGLLEFDCRTGQSSDLGSHWSGDIAYSLSPDGGILATAKGLLLDTRTKKTLARLDFLPSLMVTEYLTFSPDGSRIAAVAFNSTANTRYTQNIFVFNTSSVTNASARDDERLRINPTPGDSK